MRFWPVLAIALLVPLSAMAETFTGYVSDSRCGVKRAALSPADLKDMQDCVKAGAVPVLVVGENVMPIVYTSVAKVLPFQLKPLSRAVTRCNEFWCSRTKVVPGRMLGAPAGPRAFEPAMGAAGGPRSSLETAASVETTRAGKSPCSRI